MSDIPPTHKHSLSLELCHITCRAFAICTKGHHNSLSPESCLAALPVSNSVAATRKGGKGASEKPGDGKEGKDLTPGVWTPLSYLAGVLCVTTARGSSVWGYGSRRTSLKDDENRLCKVGCKSQAMTYKGLFSDRSNLRRQSPRPRQKNDLGTGFYIDEDWRHPRRHTIKIKTCIYDGCSIPSMGGSPIRLATVRLP